MSLILNLLPIAGVIDEDFRGDIRVLLFNLGNDDFFISRGDRIAQLICTNICYPEIEEVQVELGTHMYNIKS